MLLFYFFLIGISLFAADDYTIQESNPLFEKWRWKNFTELSDRGIRCIEEGKENELWFGTADGLVHYDGMIWTYYENEHEFLRDPIFALLYSQNGALYVVTTLGVCHLKDGIWSTDIKFPPTGVISNEWEILNINETTKGDLWLGIYTGLFRISKKTITFFTTPEQIQDTREHFSGITVKDMTGVYDGVGSFIIYDVLEDQSGNLWLALEDGRSIAVFDQNHNIQNPSRHIIYGSEDNMKPGKVTILFETKDGIIYNVSQSIEGGVNSYDPKSQSWSNVTLSELFGGDDTYFSICETEDSTLWIGGFGRAFSMKDNGEWQEYKQPEVQISANRIIFHSTSDGSLWLVNHMSDMMRIEYATPQWQTFKDLLFQCETTNGDRWFINSLGKVIINRANNTWEQISDEIELSDPVSIFQDYSSRIWVSGSHEGAAALAWFQNGMWNRKSFPELCWSFHPQGNLQTRDSAIWFGANADCGEKSFGIVQYDPQKGEPVNDDAWYDYKSTEICETAYALGETVDNSIICGFYKGLYEYDKGEMRILHDVLINDIIKVESMIQDSDQGVWIGTRSQGVIYYINDQEWRQYTTKEGLVSNATASMMITDKGSLWIATDKGISSFDGENWTKLALPNDFKMSRGNGFLKQGRDSSIWINNASLDWYRRVFYSKVYTLEESPLISYKITPEKIPPDTYIESYEEKVYYPGNTTIHWKGVDQWNETASEDLQFSYRLDDGEWSAYSTEKSFTFLSMKRGNYTLYVKARDNFNNEDLSPATVEFKVIPPLWGQVWFLILSTGIVGIIAYQFIGSIRKNRAMKAQTLLMQEKNKDLEQQQHEIEKKGEQIMELLENERENSWLNEGVIKISEAIRENKDDLSELTKQVLIQTVRFLKIFSGAIMIYNDDEVEQGGEVYLELIATYGVDSERYGGKKMSTSSGLVGACFMDKKSMIVSNIPDNYIVESGLGSSKVRSLALVPLKIHEDIVGVIEVGSLQTLDSRSIKLLELVGENIASNIQGLQTRQKVEKMYLLSKDQTEKLAEQEEEMRQQMEELQATQEESHRRETELIQSLEKCKKELKALNKSKK